MYVYCDLKIQQEGTLIDLWKNDEQFQLFGHTSSIVTIVLDSNSYWSLSVCQYTARDYNSDHMLVAGIQVIEHNYRSWHRCGSVRHRLSVARKLKPMNRPTECVHRTSVGVQTMFAMELGDTIGPFTWKNMAMCQCQLRNDIAYVHDAQTSAAERKGNLVEIPECAWWWCSRFETWYCVWIWRWRTRPTVIHAKLARLGDSLSSGAYRRGTCCAIGDKRVY